MILLWVLGVSAIDTRRYNALPPHLRLKAGEILETQFQYAYGFRGGLLYTYKIIIINTLYPRH